MGAVRVLLLTGHYTAGPGGAETVVALTEEVLRGAGHETVPFAVDEPGTLETPWRDRFPPPAGAGARTEPGRRFAGVYSRPARRALEALVREARPDVAHVHHVFEFLTLSVLDVLRAHRIPVVMTVHDYRPVCPNYRLFAHGRPCERCLHSGRTGRTVNVVRHRCLSGEGSAWRAVASAAEAPLAALRGWWRTVDVFVAPSAFLRDRLVEGGMPAGRMAVVPNPVPAGAEPAAPARARSGSARVVYCGRLVPEKGLNVLLSAARRLPQGVQVEVYGGGRAEADLRRRIAQEDLPVEMRGFAPPAGVARALEGATAAVLPALWYENCPMSLLEAASRAVPPVASRIGGIPELVTHGRDGLLVPPGDPGALATALRTLVSAPGYAGRLGAAARRRVLERHAPDRYREALLDCYARAVARGRAG
ncbi:glycosyltransferase [Streptomyces radiopugnans]|uniref:glycosyltransferase n=1 Tax=Streptomyces radiopugnans TaxID=403935 RepID=UPI003F1A58AF